MTEPRLGSYAYCIVSAAEGRSLEGLSGVDPSFGVELVTRDGLSAVVSKVRLEEFGADALKRNLEDIDWLERTARAHDAVLARALDCDGVVPLRLCTIFTDQAHVAEMLEREREHLVAELGRLRGHAEWSVKILADPKALERLVRERSPALAAPGPDAEGQTPGRAFFARKQQDRNIEEEARGIAAAAAEEAHERLREHATAATLLRPQNPELSRRSGHMVLNGAYLVERSRAAAFTATAEQLRERQRGLGLELDLTGPWAPYNFATSQESTR